VDFIIFILAMGALVYGADFIIKESERIALHFNISHFVIGATLVAFGTSLPEMAASMMAAMQDKSDMAVANVIGSITFNITLVLSVVFFISKKLSPKRNLFTQDSAWVILPIVIFFIMIQDGVISRLDAILLLLLMVGYLLFLFTDSKEDFEKELDKSIEKEKFNWSKSILLLSIGFIFTIVGADEVIDSASNIARTFGVSEWVIGLFLISFGTSLPELVVSIVAARKGNADMSIGNIIGSNVANISMVLGASSLIHPLTINLVTSKFDLFILASASIALLFILANKLYNKAGAMFLLIILFLFISHSF